MRTALLAAALALFVAPAQGQCFLSPLLPLGLPAPNWFGVDVTLDGDVASVGSPRAPDWCSPSAMGTAQLTHTPSGAPIATPILPAGSEARLEVTNRSQAPRDFVAAFTGIDVAAR